MRLRTSLLLGLGALAGSCDPVSGVTSAWPGTYEATFDGTVTVIEPAGMPPLHAVSKSTLTVSPTETLDVVLFAWRRGLDPANASLAFRVAGDEATFVPDSALNAPFVGELSPDAVATTVCTSCTARLAGDTITQTQSGMAGGTLHGVPWTGTYTGTWTATRASADGGRDR